MIKRTVSDSFRSRTLTPYDLRIAVPPELLRRAREAAGERDATISHVVRLALAKLAGERVEDYTPKRGRPRKATEETERKTSPE
jgi:hypothetical protein